MEKQNMCEKGKMDGYVTLSITIMYNLIMGARLVNCREKMNCRTLFSY